MHSSGLEFSKYLCNDFLMSTFPADSKLHDNRKQSSRFSPWPVQGTDHGPETQQRKASMVLTKEPAADEGHSNAQGEQVLAKVSKKFPDKKHL